MGPVLVIGNGAKEGVVKAVAETRDELDRMFGIAGVDLDGSLDLRKVKAAWAIVFGGDGAILSASRRMGNSPLPTLAVNFGRLGFLTEIEYRDFSAAVERVKEGRIHTRERMRLHARVGDWSFDALNDVVVTGLQSGRVFHVAARIGGREAFKYVGDGVVIATPTGSTAYSLAAGGPILSPEMEATVITPLCAHALSQRALVVPGDDEIELGLDEEDPAGRVVVDGQVSCELHDTDRLRVRKSRRPFIFIRVGIRSHFKRMRRILGWGK